MRRGGLLGESASGREPCGFADRAVFNGVRFAGDVHFAGVTFGGHARFNGASSADEPSSAPERPPTSRARFDAAYRLEDLRPSDLGEAGEGRPLRSISFHNARFRGGVIADLPAAQFEAAGMDIGGASRLIVRGPVALDEITLNHPLTILTASRKRVAELQAAHQLVGARPVLGASSRGGPARSRGRYRQL
ncbi:MAG TPA: hypothetical protein VGJ86_02165 [Acidimicrobiales bacterium]